MGGTTKSLRRSTQYWQFDSTIMHLLPMTGVKERAHLMASAFAWRGKVVFTFIAPANTNSPLKSIATAAIASTLILKDKLGEGIQV